MSNKYNSLQLTDKLCDIISEEQLTVDRIRTRDCLMYLKKSNVSDTQKHGMLLFMRKLIEQDDELGNMSVRDFTDTLEEYEEYTKCLQSKKSIMRGVEDRREE